VVPFELDNSLQLAAGRFIFSQQMIRRVTMPCLKVSTAC
jgi:hypothetical protein